MTRQPTPLFPAVLHADRIALGYAGSQGRMRTVLEDFSLELKAGEVVAVLGPSGVGKSSLLRVLAGLQPPAAGVVKVHGGALRGPHPRVSLMFQDACLLPWLSLAENVAFGLDFANQPKLDATARRERVRQMIAEVDLEHARGRYPAELSGGMAQRVALARSLVRQPELLLLDEPFSALDEITRGEMQQLLRTLVSRRRTAAVLVTHDIDEALILADRIVLLGGAPAGTLGEWRLEAGHPRDLVAGELTRVRGEIVHALRRAREAGSLTRQAAA